MKEGISEEGRSWHDKTIPHSQGFAQSLRDFGPQLSHNQMYRRQRLQVNETIHRHR